jgi:hypothetical protein
MNSTAGNRRSIKKSSFIDEDIHSLKLMFSEKAKAKYHV